MIRNSSFVRCILLFLPTFLVLCSTVSYGENGIGSLISPGELSKAHAKYEGIKNCTQCHELGSGVPDGKCLNCHKKLAERISSKSGLHTTFTDPCIKCHSDHKGRGYKMIIIEKESFNHDATGYALKEKHDTDCEKCHKKEGVYTGLSTECTACHKDEHKGRLDKNCSKCHNFNDWKEVEKFRHDLDTRYPLTGKHIEVKCLKCHENKNFKIDEFEKCITCHKDPHKGKPECKDCHTTESWKKVAVDHDKTRYPLMEKHAQVSCSKCHKNNQLKGIPFTTCESSTCHSDPHKKQFKDKKCDACHNIKGWKPSLFRHDAPEYKGFKLEGKHVDTKCEKCHIQGKFKPLNSKSCETGDCHRDEHKGQFKDRKCDACHTVKGWKPSLFKHESPEYKGYKLDGKHANVKCEKCHIDGKYNPLSTRCIDCHKKDDIHKNELGSSCEKCHNTGEWKKYSLNHNTQTKFPLVGRHVEIQCEKCHKDQKYKTGAEKCKDCHRDVHKGKFKEECNSCHTQSDWIPRKFDHKAMTGHELKGIHNDILCTGCHQTKGEYKKVPRLCNQCHSDPHLNQFGSLDCADCHNESSWNPFRFSHSNTGFSLRGKHRLAECGDCHRNRVYRNTPLRCSYCHPSPASHLASGFSSDCTSCHNTSYNSWSFTHPAVSSGCSACHLTYSDPVRPASHTTNNYGTTCENCHTSTSTWSAHKHSSVTSGCSTCHLTYSNPQRPSSHSTTPTKYPTNCEMCHTSTTSWSSHTHPAATSGCSTCHQSESPSSHSSGGYGTVCENCHKTTTAWTFSHSGIVSGCSTCHSSDAPSAHNTYSSRFGTSCENCHRYPTWLSASFSHWFSPFPVPHRGYSKCSDCHPGSNYGNKGGCIECHSAVGAKVHESGSNSGCLSCHSTGQAGARRLRRR